MTCCKTNKIYFCLPEKLSAGRRPETGNLISIQQAYAETDSLSVYEILTGCDIISEVCPPAE
jgi:hypothetical protein